MNRKPFLSSFDEASAYYTTHSRDTTNIVSCLNKIIIDGENPITALVVGCGNGQHDLLPLVKKMHSLRSTGKRHKIFAIDKSESMIALLEENLKVFCNANSLTFTTTASVWKFGEIEVVPICMSIEDDVLKIIKSKVKGEEIFFDLVILFAVLQHTTSWRQVLNTLIHKVMDGGSVLVDEWFDSPLAMLDIAHKNPQWHYYFSLREKYTGIFWDPEVKAHDILAIKNYFLGHGFDLIPFFDSQPGQTVPQSSIDLTENVRNAFGFGPLSWGKGSLFELFVKETLKKEEYFYIPTEKISFKVYCFQKPQQLTMLKYDRAVTTANLITSTPVYETRIMNHFCVEINPSLLREKTDIRQVQALQLGLQYSCFSAKTHFAFPIQARIDNAGIIVKGTGSARTLLVPNKEETVDILTRLMANMLVLKGYPLVKLGSVTADLLNIFQEQPQYSNYSFRLRVKHDSPLTVQPKVIDGVDVIECSFPCYPEHPPYTMLRNKVRLGISEKMEESTQYAFGEFKVVDLNTLMQDVDGFEDEIKNSGNLISKYYESLFSDNGNLGEYKELLSLFCKLVPMMNDGESLLLIFSPCQYIVDEQDVKIKSVSFGAFAILERQFEEPDSMFAFRLARLEFLNLVLQWEKYNQRYELSHMRGEQLSAESEILKKHSQMLELLQGPLESLTSLLNKTQEDTQTLRSILYDPHRSLFEAAPQVKKYFDRDRRISFGKVSWKTIHEPSGTTNPKEMEVMANTIAAIVCEVFGSADFLPKNRQELYAIASALLKSEEAAFSEYRSLLSDIVLGFSDIPFKDYTKLTNAFSDLKAILFTPYKDGDKKRPILPLLIIIYDINKTCKVKYRNKDFQLTDVLSKYRSNNMFLKDLPIPRYSNLLELISGVLVYANGKTGITLLNLELSDNDIKLIFSGKVYDLEELKKAGTFQSMKEIIDKRVRPLYVGDFQKPFFEFASICFGVDNKVSECTDNKITIAYGSNKLSISINENNFILTID